MDEPPLAIVSACAAVVAVAFLFGPRLFIPFGVASSAVAMLCGLIASRRYDQTRLGGIAGVVGLVLLVFYVTV